MRDPRDAQLQHRQYHLRPAPVMSRRSPATSTGPPSRTPPASARSNAARLAVGGEAEPVAVTLGVGVSPTESRRDRLTQGQRDALRELGMRWA
ncbi:hypothetical protein [Streptomyces gibsoniae]|uniref:Helicase-associated domain-containing protein n=1 Tax=Streptomyces gibsoniae TaxID=3075529 RepID=A0ABU2U8R7_9ACTN|nr:hypothetical protein [Streptomyces sp. DSM 41699]MDT0469625.1 hypothetical protein [Streptomyces sp. DSM 41699]